MAVGLTQRKTFIKSFVKQIVMGRKNVKMNHKLPGSEGLSTESAFLAIETFGGAEGIRTPDPLNANQMLYH
jgi:site-specific DNA recombinase